MNVSEFLTIVLDYGKVEGRTTLQKLAYFASLKVRLNLDFVAHYYGPYSPTIAVALESMSALGLIKEEVRWSNRNQRAYTYSLTKDGEAIVHNVERNENQACEKIRNEVARCMEVSDGRSKVLIWAAKVHYILSKRKKPASYLTIRKIAKSFGWDISSDEIDSGATLLQELGLAKTRKSKGTSWEY